MRINPLFKTFQPLRSPPYWLPAVVKRTARLLLLPLLLPTTVQRKRNRLSVQLHRRLRRYGKDPIQPALEKKGYKDSN